MAVFQRILLALFLAALAGFGVAEAQERVELLVSDVALQIDGSAEVTETIRVVSQGRNIRRGIIRDVTNVLDGTGGARVVNEYEVHSVTRDGQAEPFEVTESARQFHIRIGGPEQLLPPGSHEYVIRYRLSRIARAFENHDEIYWNATGNEWQFRIERAVARISLPNAAQIKQTASFTGPVGSTGTNATIRQESSQVVEFSTSVPLQPGEGLTVAVAFNKGVVTFPGGVATLVQAIKDRINFLVGAALALVSILFNVFAWFRFGRDPKRGVIFPRFYPPKDVSPATLVYIANRGNFRNEAFTAGLFNLAVQELVRLENDPRQKSLKVTRTSKAAPATLFAEERGLANAITPTMPVVLDGKKNSVVQTLYSGFMRTVGSDNKRKWIKPNIGISVAGAAILLALFGWMGGQDEIIDLWIIGLVFGIFFFIMIRSFFQKLQGHKREWLAVFGALAIFSGGAYLVSSINVVSWPGLAGWPLLAGALVTAVFLPQMSALTPKGRAVLDEIEGFRMYLETAEQERLNMEEPEFSMERFEAILPYAIALKLEKPWTQRFETYLAKAMTAGTAMERASSLGAFDVSATRSAVNNVARSVQASTSSSNSSSSSGFSGGSSGGGSGGGGGRGW